MDAPVIRVGDRYRRRLVSAGRDLMASGLDPTVERLAERLDVSPRTVRRWQQMSAR